MAPEAAGDSDYKTAELRQSPSGLASQQERQPASRKYHNKGLLESHRPVPTLQHLIPTNVPLTSLSPGTDTATMKGDIQAKIQGITAIDGI